MIELEQCFMRCDEPNRNMRVFKQNENAINIPMDDKLEQYFENIRRKLEIDLISILKLYLFKIEI